MDPLNIHHVIRHPLSRIKTNNFQDKSGCSINGIRSFLFEEGIARDLGEMSYFIEKSIWLQDYRGYPIRLSIKDFKNFPLSDKILRMKNVRFYKRSQSTPIHQLVSPEPHFVEEERNILENHFKYLGETYENEDIEDWDCFEMDCEGHLVSIDPGFNSKLLLTNESIEHLSNFPHLTNLRINSLGESDSQNRSQNWENFSCLAKNLRSLSLSFISKFQELELLQDLGLFSNLVYLSIHTAPYSSLIYLIYLM